MYPRSPPVFRFVDGTSRANGASSILAHFDRSARRPPGLVKQAYSAWVYGGPNARPRKWHLTAYFTYTDLQNLPTIDSDPLLRSIRVPQGVYRTGKARSRNSDLNIDTSRESTTSSASSSPPPTPGELGGWAAPGQRMGGPWQNGEAKYLPPLSSAVAGDIPARLSTPRPSQRDQRFAEDQRVIHMLNTRHIR